MRQGTLIAAVAAAVLCAAPVAATAAPPPNVPWPQLLPALPSKGGPPPPVAGCARASLACIDRVIARMDTIRRGFGCDHRAVFALTYERLTEAIRELVKGWREGVWRNAERLIAARSDAERAQISAQIQGNAALWARTVFASAPPGYRAARDAYCATHNV